MSTQTTLEASKRAAGGGSRLHVFHMLNMRTSVALCGFVIKPGDVIEMGGPRACRCKPVMCPVCEAAQLLRQGGGPR